NGLVLVNRHIEAGGKDAPPTGTLSADVKVLQEDYFYDGGTSIDLPGNAFAGGFKGVLTRKRVYRDFAVGQINGNQSCPVSSTQNGPACVDYGFWYEATTGNKAREVKPSAMASGSNNPQTATPFTSY